MSRTTPEFRAALLGQVLNTWPVELSAEEVRDLLLDFADCERERDAAERDVVAAMEARDASMARAAAAEARVRKLVDAAEHFRYCGLAGGSIEFRCNKCNDFDAAIEEARAALAATPETGEPTP